MVSQNLTKNNQRWIGKDENSLPSPDAAVRQYQETNQLAKLGMYLGHPPRRVGLVLAQAAEATFTQ